MSLSTSQSKLLAKGITSFSSFTTKSPSAEAIAQKPYMFTHVPTTFSMYQTQLQGKMGMRYIIFLKNGTFRVFHSPVLVEDTEEDPPVPTLVAILGDNIQSQTYISLDPALFNQFSLVLMSTRSSLELKMTKSPVAITDLLDDSDVKVELTTIQWPNVSYPGTPDIVSLPLVHGIPPSYSAHDNHKVANAFPIDVPG